MNLPVYLDHQATTPVDPRVLEAMLPYFREHYGNPASRTHGFGWKAEEALEEARAAVSALIGATAKEIVFTSGATEAINLALKGAAEMYAAKGRHILTSAAEHKAVLDTCKHLESRGFVVQYLRPGSGGAVRHEELAAALRPDTILVSIMWANNEVGSISPVRAIGELCHERGVLFFSDASQAVGKIQIDVERDRVDLLALSAHKLYGPKGVGALYVRRKDPRVRLRPQIDGGGQERGLRAGTPNVPGIVGLGAACRIARAELADEAERTRRLRDTLEERLLGELEGVVRNGDPLNRLPNCSNLSFRGVEGEALLLGLEGLALSSGSACTSGSLEPSHVLRAMGVGEDLSHRSLRFGLGRTTTAGEIEYAADRIVETVRRLRGLAGPAAIGSGPAARGSGLAPPAEP